MLRKPKKKPDEEDQDEEQTVVEDQEKQGYYYDDAHGYEPYNAEDVDEAEDDTVIDRSRF